MVRSPKAPSLSRRDALRDTVSALSHRLCVSRHRRAIYRSSRVSQRGRLSCPRHERRCRAPPSGLVFVRAAARTRPAPRRPAMRSPRARAAEAVRCLSSEGPPGGPAGEVASTPAHLEN
ncbi:hypothetical protein PsYK624_171850, partial [Phanerochaete sordida]